MISFLMVSTFLNASQINSYNIEVKLDDSQKQLIINVVIDLQHEQADNIELLLSSKCTISSITASNKKSINYSI